MGRTRQVIRATIGVAAVVGAASGIVLSEPATADDPEVCGYVKLSDDGGTPTTVTSIPYCERPCSGPGVGVPPGHVNEVHWEVLVCTQGL